MRKTLVILNGPPRSGKDSVADASTYTKVGFKRHLLKAALAISGVNEKLWNARYDSCVETTGFSSSERTYSWCKDIAWELLGGLSQREFLIRVSEEWMKPVFGKGVFGERLKEDLDLISVAHHQLWTKASIFGDVYISSDGGFVEEVQPFLDDPDWNVIIVRLFRDGCSFEGDSRNYLLDLCEDEIDIDGNGSILEVTKDVEWFVTKVIKESK